MGCDQTCDLVVVELQDLEEGQLAHNLRLEFRDQSLAEIKDTQLCEKRTELSTDGPKKKKKKSRKPTC